MTHKFQTNFRTLFEACPSKRWLNSVWTWVELRATGALAAESWGRLFVRWLLLDPAISTAMTVSSVADGMHNAVRGGPNGLDHAHRGQTVVRAGQDGRGVQVTRSGIAQSQTEGEEYELEAGRVAHLINFFIRRTGQDRISLPAWTFWSGFDCWRTSGTQNSKWNSLRSCQKMVWWLVECDAWFL